MSLVIAISILGLISTLLKNNGLKYEASLLILWMKRLGEYNQEKGQKIHMSLTTKCHKCA